MSEEIHLRYDDGYPEGFSLLDNRDIWDGTGRDRKALLRPATLGVYVSMCSLPRGWAFREAWLTDRLGIGRDALRRIVRELVNAGRLRKDEIRDEKGRYVRTDWTLLRAGSPRTGNPSMDIGSPSTGFPTTAKPTAGKPAPLVNKEEAVSTETTTTAPARLDWSDPALSKLSERQRVVVGEALNALDEETQQDVLDELTDYAANGDFTKGPISLARKLAKRALEGEFNFDRGMKVRERRLAKSRPEKKRRPGENTESPYENAVNYARQTFGPDAAEPNKAELAKRLAEAAEKWPEEAKKNSVAASTCGKRDAYEQSKHNLPMQGAAP